jgi:membrane-associated phospholipid phosphatase
VSAREKLARQLEYLLLDGCLEVRAGNIASVPLKHRAKVKGRLFLDVLKELDNDVEKRLALKRRRRVVSVLGHLASRGGDLAPIIYALLWVKSDSRKALKSAGFVAVQALVVNYALKPIFKRNRPDFSGRTSSFPSGHAATAVSSALMVPVGGGVMFGVAAATSIGRILRGAHWLSDVVAGSAIGLTTALIFRRLNR